MDNIISECPILAKEQYVKRHDKVSAQIHFNICKEIGVQLDKNTGTKMYHISSNKSKGQDDYTVESASAN
jgi:hypothetical protein